MDSFFLPLLSPFLPPVSLPCCHTVSPLSFSTCKSTYIISQLCCKPSSSSLINRLPHLYSSFFSLVGCTTVNLTLTHFLTARRAQLTHEKNVQDSLRRSSRNTGCLRTIFREFFDKCSESVASSATRFCF